MGREAEALYRIISASVRDTLDAYRIQASAGPVTDKALEVGRLMVSSRALPRTPARNRSRCCRVLCGCC